MNEMDSTSSTPSPSRRFGRYESVRPAGVGGMATVWLGNVEEDGETRNVAIKCLHEFIAEDPANIAILEDEARLASCVHHPNVVGVLELVPAEDGTPPALVMEWVDGVNLSALAAAANRSGERLPVDVVVAIMRDVLAGLHAAHEARRDDGLALEIVHRDVSPQNILVGVDGVTRLTDFGVAKATWRTQATELGAIKGKLAYMAPEQLEGRVDRRADLFAAGVVLWELLTGARLRDGDGVQILVQILHSRVVAPSERAPSAAVLDDIVMRALASEPDERFATTAEMAEVLVGCVAPATAERVAEVVVALTGGPTPPYSSHDPTPFTRDGEPTTDVTTERQMILPPVDETTAGPARGRERARATRRASERARGRGAASRRSRARRAGAPLCTPPRRSPRAARRLSSHRDRVRRGAACCGATTDETDEQDEREGDTQPRHRPAAGGARVEV